MVFYVVTCRENTINIPCIIADNITICLSVSVFVRFNLGPGVAVEVDPGSSVGELKELVAQQHGVSAGQLRLLFAGRELQSGDTLQARHPPAAGARRPLQNKLLYSEILLFDL